MNTIQYLKHGKALCGTVFRTFVETFNWHTDFCRNLKGDYDTVGRKGWIKLDRSNPNHPIIRFIEREVKDSGGNEGMPGCFELIESDDATTLTNCYYNVGGFTRKAGNFDVTSMVRGAGSGSILYFKIAGNSVSVGLALESNLGNLQKDPKTYVVPLYVLADGRAVVDLRNAPNVQMVEFGLA